MCIIQFKINSVVSTCMRYTETSRRSNNRNYRVFKSCNLTYNGNMISHKNDRVTII